MPKEEPDPNDIMPDTPDLSEESGPEPGDELEPTVEKSWAELGMHERYDSMTREQIAADILHGNTVHGRQAEEVGQLRKQLAAVEEQFAGVKKAADLPVEVKQEVKKMSEAELGRWLEDLQTDPHMAIQSILGDNYGRRTEEELSKLIDERINDGLQGYHGYTEDQAAMADPDYRLLAGYIETLKGQDHFGNTRPTMELLELGRLVHTDKESADAVYDAMKRFPGVPMQDCIHMINGRPKNNVSADKIRKEVKGLAGGGLPGGAKKRSTTEKIEDMDAAFDID